MDNVHGFHQVKDSEVVLAFLRGEIDSPRCGEDVRRALIAVGGLDLVHHPDLGSEQENRAPQRGDSAGE